MTVLLTVSKTLGGADAADALAGGGSGVDLGACNEGEYAPIILKSANTGWQNLYIRHNGVNEITDVKTYIQVYSQTYGGNATAAADFTTLQTKGAASGNSANNGDGLSSGFRVEQDADLAGALGLSAFDGTRAQVKIYGKSALGISLATAYLIHQDAMIYNNAGTPVDATAPVAGKIGPAGNTVLGDVAYLKLRMYLETSPPGGGRNQFNYVVAYAFSA